MRKTLATSNKSVILRPLPAGRQGRAEESERRSFALLRMTVLLTVVFLFFTPLIFAASVEELDQKIKDRETTFYREFFDNIIYEPFAQLLRFDRIEDTITFEKHRALDVNIYDEVPDSGFFVNRQGRKPLSIGELKGGPAKDEWPNPQGPWRVIKGKVEGVTPGFFIEDETGGRYLLKFDPKENPEMATAAESIAHRFFYAFGYHVAEYYLVHFDPKILTADPKATYYNEDGFKKPLTQEALQELIENIPKYKGGLVRASASKLLKHKGHMEFEGRREADPDDLIPHEDRRSLRALRVFGSWLNHYDLREGNTLDVIEEENGKPIVKHYLIDFGSTLGSAAYRAKVPAAGYEHIVDWFAIGKATPTLKVVEKPWEKKWDALERTVPYPELGYFDNLEFNPGAWKTQLPYEVFQRLTREDAFWAAKIIMAFSNEDIQAIVESAKYSDPNNAQVLSEILISRRDIIGRYWFARVTPLDQVKLFDLGSGKYEIRFEDLQIKYGFAKKEDARYRYQLMVDGKKAGGHQEFEGPSFSFAVPPQNPIGFGTAQSSNRSDLRDAPSLNDGSRVTIWIQAQYGTKSGWSEPSLKVALAKAGPNAQLAISEIDHGI